MFGSHNESCDTSFRLEQRREFLRQMAAAGMATLASGAPRAVLGQETPFEHPASKADSCIVLWMGGGMAAPDTFDPKRYVPFEVGRPVAELGGGSRLPACRYLLAGQARGLD